MDAFLGVWAGNTLVRALMNGRCRGVSLAGMRVLDLGSGEAPGPYHAFFRDPAGQIMTADLKSAPGPHCRLDFETDCLPYGDGSFDAVLSFNLFEHVFDHARLMAEASRVLRAGGLLVGFVPFLVNYHPDPHDYFRYSEEALLKLFRRAGFGEAEIEAVGRGPFAVNFNNIAPLVPLAVRCALLPVALLLDAPLLRLRPGLGRRFPLGYFFVATKNSG